VWSHLDQSLRGCRSILELGCGTGEDAVHLAGEHPHIIATDASRAMIEVARRKAEAAGYRDSIEWHCLPMEQARAALAPRTFDAVLSDFGAVNCACDLPALIADIAHLVRPGGKLLWVVMGRNAPWEWAWYGLRGEWHKAWRRHKREGVRWRGLTVRYPTPTQLTRLLQPWFARDRCSPLGFALPPSYAAGWLERSPRALSVLTTLERAVQGVGILASLADHYIIEATRK
jgi:ubiquinone/menaquinone biosynthesis C-methylase UbiE